MAAVDFLPVCDLLFNLISLTCYFCDVVFVSMVTYTLYDYAGGQAGDILTLLYTCLNINENDDIFSLLSNFPFPDEEGQIAWFSVLFVSATTTLIACQILSFRSVFLSACCKIQYSIAIGKAGEILTGREHGLFCTAAE